MEKRKIKRIIVDEGTEFEKIFNFDGNGWFTTITDKDGEHFRPRKAPRKLQDLIEPINPNKPIKPKKPNKQNKPKQTSETSETYPIPEVQEPERLLIPRPVDDKYDPDKFFPKIPKLE